MPPLTLTPQEQAKALLSGSSDLAYLFGREGIPDSTQALFFHVGVTTNAKLASFATDVADFKTVVATEFGIDQATSLQMRVQVANLICVFNTAVARTSKLEEISGELEARRLQKPMPTSEYMAMIKCWENKWWNLEDKDRPARSYLEKKAEELEQGEVRAESLGSVLNYEEDDVDVLTPIWDSSGTLKMRKGHSTVPEPVNPEQLRKRVMVLGTGLMCLGLRHSNRAFLQGMTPQTFQNYLSYLLGDYVYQLTGKSAEGHTVAAPSWSQLLVYELEIRKKTWKLVYSDSDPSNTFAKCLETACKDAVCKERFFTTPVAFSSLSRATRPEFLGVSSGKGGKKGGGKFDKGKGGKGQKGGKSGKGDGKKGAPRTPDGKTICFSFNSSKTRCKNKNCYHQHVCGRCFGKHPMYMCSNNAGPEGAGQNTASA
jgi:hypothetical protein